MHNVATPGPEASRATTPPVRPSRVGSHDLGEKGAKHTIGKQPDNGTTDGVVASSREITPGQRGERHARRDNAGTTRNVQGCSSAWCTRHEASTDPR